ncbi:hypothetical protein MRB53_005632 [Persea americana]|uniref:Uncharacterized protein n=1 Tax=Persea americana TaxID=3435 RepID=A0ACC2MDV3_PERAE|nr:hypothetical protein MRB53_005632 [Persea americana]
MVIDAGCECDDNWDGDANRVSSANSPFSGCITSRLPMHLQATKMPLGRAIKNIAIPTGQVHSFAKEDERKTYNLDMDVERNSQWKFEMTKSYTKKKDGEIIVLAMKTLTKEMRTWFDEKGSRTDLDVADDVYAKASAWNHVTCHPDYFNEEMNGARFFSFPWRVPEILMHIKKKKLELTGEAE